MNSIYRDPLTINPESPRIGVSLDALYPYPTGSVVVVFMADAGCGKRSVTEFAQVRTALLDASPHTFRFGDAYICYLPDASVAACLALGEIIRRQLLLVLPCLPSDALAFCASSVTPGDRALSIAVLRAYTAAIETLWDMGANLPEPLLPVDNAPD